MTMTQSFTASKTHIIKTSVDQENACIQEGDQKGQRSHYAEPPTFHNNRGHYGHQWASFTCVNTYRHQMADVVMMKAMMMIQLCLCICLFHCVFIHHLLLLLRITYQRCPNLTIEDHGLQPLAKQTHRKQSMSSVALQCSSNRPVINAHASEDTHIRQRIDHQLPMQIE